MASKSKLACKKKPPPKLVKTLQNQEKSNSSINSSETASGLSQEEEDQFELELCWCIQQLQTGLADMKLEDKQVYNLTKSLNVLKNNNASLIKKRQVMRNTFGDYRSKMIDDEKKFGRISSYVKFIPCSKKTGKNSVFVKKANFLTNTINKDESINVNDMQLKQTIVIVDQNPPTEPFKFNFSCNKP